MALNQSPKIVTDGLVFYYDMDNGKSFVGGPVTNTLPSPAINGLPTIGNGWGTYNTNQYGSGNFFSIGTVASVSNNIVTMSSPHSLRSYDVMRPQTTGGGVTANTDYLIKKLSNTTFSLHPYNGSQDGSQGFINPATGNHKVYDDFSNDIRISINASSFPTMWWGAPHLPNSGLVKEIIPNGFNGIVGRMPTDCVRLHFIRPDNVTDGMAYGPDAAVTAGVQHTVSFWTRSVTASAVGQYLAYQIYNYGATTPTGYFYNAVLGPVGEWTKHQMTFTPNNPLAISYWFPSTGSFKCDLSNIQFEVGTVANNFAPGTRPNTEAIKDFTSNNTVTASSLTYANNGTFSFNGSNDKLTLGTNTLISGTQNYTIDAVFRTSSAGSVDYIFGNYGVSPGATAGLEYYVFQNRLNNFISGNIQSATNLNANQWYISSVVRSGTTITHYLNGQPDGSGTSSASIATVNPFTIGNGHDYTSEAFGGNIAAIKVYNRALSAAEIQQNFAAHRGRYGI
jgi:hypothetical protein